MSRFIGASMTKGAVSAPQRKPATKVCVFQCPKGALETSRRPLRLAAAQTRHFGRGSGLVQEDQPLRFKPHLRLAHARPFLARLFDVETILLAGPQSFF